MRKHKFLEMTGNDDEWAHSFFHSFVPRPCILLTGDTVLLRPISLGYMLHAEELFILAKCVLQGRASSVPLRGLSTTLSSQQLLDDPVYTWQAQQLDLMPWGYLPLCHKVCLLVPSSAVRGLES